MKKVLVESIEDGMTLAREVNGSSGNTLLTKGTPLTKALGRRLQNWGIISVFVDGEEETALQESAVAVSPENLLKHLTEKFAKTIQSPHMKTIFDAVYQFRVKKTVR